MSLGIINSNIAAKQADPYFGNRNNPVLASGGLMAVTCLYEIGSGLAANDIIRLVKVPTGAMLIPNLCWVESENPGTTLVVDIGDDDDTDVTGGDPDRYVDGINIGSAGGSAFTSADGVATLTPYQVQKESWILVDIKSASGLNAGAAIRFYLVFAINN